MSCEYHRVTGLFNRGGHLPCGECEVCREEARRLAEMNRVWPVPRSSYEEAEGKVLGLMGDSRVRLDPELYRISRAVLLESLGWTEEVFQAEAEARLEEERQKLTEF